MITWIVQSYQKMPCERKRWISKSLSPVKSVLSSINGLFFHVYEIAGNDAVLITSIQPDASFLEYFYPGAVLKPKGRIFAWSVRHTAHRYDTAVIEMHKELLPFFKDGLITVPFVRQRFDISKPPENLKQFRKHKKNILTYDTEVTRDPEVLAFFYEKMHVPYVRRRYKDALIEHFSKLQYFIEKNGELLLLKTQGNVIGGVFCKQIGDTFHMLNIGLIDDSYLKADAMDALYYFAILRAKERGFRYIDFGESRPFLSDGVLEHKRRWGGDIIPNERNKYFFYLKNIGREDLIFLENDKLTAQFSPEGAKTLRPDFYPGVEIRVPRGSGVMEK